ncbi:hypothetical protein BDZ94DRAFT_1283531 [Collybia nuda]|uniref:Pentatricopeptide repeat-containing protein-mitochondrial domain-containing protein n=1 Tax=Collybia nuda TaxID=64659 RepID=A0A9P6CD23_9AGAR|nr:hypothetical protein BDZ94DRAFT_1283531 [Collybia nuda]
MKLIQASEHGRYYESLAIAAEMKQAGMRPQLSTYTSLIHAASRDGSWLDAWAIFDDMILAGIKPNVGVFNWLIHAQRHRGSPYLFEVVNKMNELGVAPTATTFHHIVQRYVLAENLEVALQYFYAMKNRNIIPDVRSAQAIISLASQKGYPRLAIDLARWFEEVSVRRLDHTVWMNILIASANCLYEEGVLLSWKMAVQEFKIAPDEGLCSVVLHTAARHGLPDLATDVLRILKVMGAPWKEHHFAPLVEAFCRAGQIKEAIVALDIMRTNEIEARMETAYPIVNIEKGVEAVDATWAIIDELHKGGKNIDIAAFQVLIRASVFLKDLQRAVGAYKSLPEYGVSPDLPIFNLLLQGCVSASHRKLGSLLLDDMQAAKIKPDQETYVQFILLCLTQDTYEDAFFYLEEMKTASFTPPRSVYEAIIQKCLTARDTRYTIAIQEMKETGYELSDRLARQLDDTTRKNKQDTEAGRDNMPDRLPDLDQQLGLDGAAKAFIETGGLTGSEEMGKAPGTYPQ